jgi:hypothetical protein
VTKTNHIKIMVDYDLIDPEIIKALETFSVLDVKTILQCGHKQHTPDKTLVDDTDRLDRILLTADAGISEKRYKPCEHGGIILIDDPRPTPQKVRAFMKTILQCGERQLCKRHVTRLSKRRIKIFTHDKKPRVVKIHEDERLRRIVQGL